MPIDGISVGSNIRTVVCIGDPTTSSYYESVVPVADATNVSGKNAGLILASPALLNASGNLDRARAAPGTTGIPSINIEGTKATYSTISLDFTPAATATDIWSLIGSATKTVRLLRLAVTGLATAAATVDLRLLFYSAANTGGTATQPVLVSHDSNNAAATAVVNLYSANPTLGTLVGGFRARKLNLGAAGAAGMVVWDFSTNNDQAFVLRGVAQQISLNWNGQAVPSGTSLDIEAEFTEE
jgi:hypothetical protein